MKIKDVLITQMNEAKELQAMTKEELDEQKCMQLDKFLSHGGPHHTECPFFRMPMSRDAI